MVLGGGGGGGGLNCVEFCASAACNGRKARCGIIVTIEAAI